MQYKVVKRQNPQDRSSEAYYASPYYSETVTVNEIAKDLSDASTLNRVDIVACLEGFLTRLPSYLMRGNKVKLNNFGIFKLGFHSKGQKTAEDVSAGDILGAHINFLPAKEMLTTIKESCTYSTPFKKETGNTESTEGSSAE